MSKTSIAAAAEVPVSAGRRHGEVAGLVLYLVLLSLVFISPLVALVRHALDEEIHSHILLIPLASIYLCRDGWKGSLGRKRTSAVIGAVALALIAAMLWMAPFVAGNEAALTFNDRLSHRTAVYVLLAAAGGFLFLGGARMRQLAFPFAFLVFMIPLPDAAISGAENLLIQGSAWAAHATLDLAGVPVFRQGQVLELPGVTLEVARECSGIRSTLVLLITTLLAGHLFLGSSVHKALLVAVVLPLGILRNALRVAVLGGLSVHIGPEVLDTWVHHHGGPLFFAISLVPVFLLAGWFRLRESGKQPAEPAPAKVFPQEKQ